MRRTPLASRVRPVRTALGLAAAAALVTGLASCGSSSGGGGSDSAFASEKPADQFAAAKTDMAALTSAKLTGSITSGGSPINLDIAVSTTGDCAGTIGLGAGTAQILSTGGTTWIKPDAAFLKSYAGASADKVIAAIGSKYLLIPSTQAASFNSFCNLTDLLKQLFDGNAAGTTYTEDGTSSVGGQDAVKVALADPKEGTSIAYILSGGKHYVAKVEKVPSSSASPSPSASASADSDSGAITFSDFDAPVDATAPDPSDVFDLSSLTGG